MAKAQAFSSTEAGLPEAGLGPGSGQGSGMLTSLVTSRVEC